MTRNRRIVLAVALVLGGIAATEVIPPLADHLGLTPQARPFDWQQFQQGREQRLRDQLQPFVDDGTITADQADRIAAKLAQPGGGPGGRRPV